MTTTAATPTVTTSIGPWRPTTALFRSVVAATVLAVVAVLWRRPDLLVLATPMAVVSVWSIVAKPTELPTLEERLANHVIREGDATSWHGTVGNVEGADIVSSLLRPTPWVELDPAGGSVNSAVTDGAASVSIVLRSTRWGREPVQAVLVDAMSQWTAFRCAMETPHRRLTTLPLPSMFDAAAPMRPAEGLVGLYRSSLPGEGSEFAAVRNFQPGDRIRRINWTRSLRATGLQVNATWADQDTHVALVIDGTDDYGVSEGIDGQSSSMDAAVRAAGSIAEHYARRGDRVSLRTFGTTRRHLVPAGSGQNHLRRLLDTLTHIRAAGPMRGIYRGLDGRHWAPNGAELTVVLSPLVAREALDRAVSLGRHGSAVVVVDTLPDDIATDDDPFTALAWRIRLLERRREIRLVERAGIPVVRWLGPGSLDQFLRDVARRASAPRMRVR